MKFIENVRIRTRMMWLAGVTVISLVALGAVYVTGNGLMSKASRTADDYGHLADLMQRVEVGALDMRRREKDFFLRLDMKFTQLYAESATSVLQTLDETAAEPAATSMLKDVRALRAAVESHKAQFEKVVALEQKMGLTEADGLQGKLRDAVHAVEAKLKEANLDALTVQMLMMRRHEKDFMLRGKEKYIGELDESRHTFSTLLAKAPVSDAFKQQVTALMDTYQKDFHAWADTHFSIVKESGELSRIFAGMEPLLDKTFKVSDAGNRAAHAELERVKGFTWALFLSIGAVILALSVGLTFIIGRSIVSSISRMTSVMSRMAEGDNNQDIPAVDNKDEIGAMARAVLVFKKNGLERERLEEEQRQQQARREQQMQRMEELTQDFDRQAKQVVGSVAAAADELQNTAENMSATAEETNRQAAAVAAASEEAIDQRADRRLGVGGDVGLDRRDQPPGSAVGRDGEPGRCRGRAHQRDGAGHGGGGAEDRRGGQPDQRDRRADQPAGAQCDDRGGARRRGRQGLRGRRLGGQEPRDPDRQGDGGHLGPGQRDAVRDRRRGGGDPDDRLHHQRDQVDLRQHRGRGRRAGRRRRRRSPRTRSRQRRGRRK